MELTRKEIDDELEHAFRLLDEQMINRVGIIKELTTPEDGILKILADRFDKKRNTRNEALEYLKRLVRNDCGFDDYI